MRRRGGRPATWPIMRPSMRSRSAGGLRSVCSNRDATPFEDAIHPHLDVIADRLLRCYRPVAAVPSRNPDDHAEQRERCGGRIDVAQLALPGEGLQGLADELEIGALAGGDGPPVRR